MPQDAQISTLDVGRTAIATAERCELYRIDTACDLLQISRAKLYRLLTSGEIASVKIGRSRRIPAAAVAAFVAGLEHKQARAA